MGQIARVAISSDFLNAFAGLPQAVQSKVSKFLTLFQRDPTGPGINYERINSARDPNMRSVRIDDAWRGIVLKPEQGNVFLLRNWSINSAGTRYDNHSAVVQT
jgi:hypothetical protein